ncbi:abscission/NoCut checkpoint regulator [Culex pipiens pallens]|uniref:abscission/NoCut checkpoint regulator n=1 Tax=Culex pipiens pallens TaxID=42434 RepID=UPI0019542E38|nr:abscission/NoCut checkpoint regulator [Culex pipiens pallens]
MACNGCTKKFGLFLKENGCPSCKYSFCSKCLKFRIKLNGKNRDVCLRCFEFSKLDTNSNAIKNVTEKNSSILDATSAETVQLPEVIQPVSNSTSQPDADDLIRERLAALKDPPAEEGTASSSPATNPESSLTDIEKRLAALKGVEYKDYSEANKKFLLQKDNRTQEEQIRDLMKQFAEEQEIHETVSEYRLAAVDDIEKRLAALKGEPGDKPKKPNGIPSDDEEETEEEAARKLAVRFLEEAAIDAQNPAKEDGEDEDVLNNLDIPKPLDPAEIEEELPWCTICNEDAVVRCLSCDGDLFCRGCFRECHEDDEDYRAHKTKPYKGKSVPGEG